jgi:hypothetical protein
VPPEASLAEIVRGALRDDGPCSLPRIRPELGDHGQALAPVALRSLALVAAIRHLDTPWDYLSTIVLRRIIVIFPISAGAHQRVRRLVEEEFPFAPGDLGLERHHVFVTDAEVVLFFEGAEAALARVIDDPSVAAGAWHQYVAGPPHVAEDAYSWASVEANDGLSFAATPGPGDSEGGDVYPP